MTTLILSEILPLLPTLQTETLEQLAGAMRAELDRRTAAAAPRKIVLRSKDLNSRGNGDQVTRRLRLPDGTTGWASDHAQDVSGDWQQGHFRASERRCAERGYVPVGTIVLEYTSTLRGGQKAGRASLAAGVVVSEERGRELRAADGNDGSAAIEWGLSTRRKGQDVEVQLPSGEWMEV